MRLAVDRTRRGRAIWCAAGPVHRLDPGRRLLAARPPARREIAQREPRGRTRRSSRAAAIRRGAAVPGRGRAGAEERVDRRRRRVGLRHRLRRPRSRAGARLKVNVLVLDTEVYSNTGGQQSKATPIGAGGQVRGGRSREPARRTSAPWRACGHVYVAGRLRHQDTQTVKAFVEADASGTVADHRLQPLHRARLRPDDAWSTSRSSPSTRATGRSIADPRRARSRRARAGPGLGAPKSRSSSSLETRRASGWSSSGIRRGRASWRGRVDRHPNPPCRRSEDRRRPIPAPARAGAARRRGALTWTSRPPTSDCRWRTR
jgi:hypothetical protein